MHRNNINNFQIIERNLSNEVIINDTLFNMIVQCQYGLISTRRDIDKLTDTSKKLTESINQINRNIAILKNSVISMNNKLNNVIYSVNSLNNRVEQIEKKINFH